MSNTDTKMEDIVSLAKRRGFIFQGSEVYGGIAGFYDYGPLGVALKRNITNLWWRMFVESRDDMFGIDAAIIMNPKVWQASGHVTTFADPMIECMNCQTRYRADKFLPGLPKTSNDLLWSEKWVDAYRAIHGFNDEADLSKAINACEISFNEKKNVCPSCRKPAEYSEPEQFNMMFKTVVGPKYVSWDRKVPGGLKAHVKFMNEEGSPEKKFDLEDSHSELGGFMFYDTNSVGYLRPETAQGIFTNYKNVVDTLYPDLPFGLAQIGKAFRNEISPRDFIFRVRELEQMEIEYFVNPNNWEAEFEKWRVAVHAWLDALGLSKDKVHELNVEGDDLAHYSKRTIDFEYDFPIGREELLGLAYRTDFDLGNIQRVSSKSMEYTVKGSNERFVPHVIEPSFGVERALMAVLSEAYTEDEVNGEKRVYLKLPEHLAPVKYCVSPLLKNKPELVAKAREVYEALRAKHGAVMWDDNGNIGKRYRRQDEIGTPYCVVIDFDTLEDGTVTIRDRDTTEQSRQKIDELLSK